LKKSSLQITCGRALKSGFYVFMNFLQPKILLRWPARTWCLAWLCVALGLGGSRVLAQSLPGVITGSGISLRSGQTMVNGTINPNQAITAYWFEHGPTSGYGHFTPTNSLPAGTSVVTVSNLLTSLPRGSVYHFRLVASNSVGLAAGGHVKFTARAGSNVASSVTGGGQPVDLRQPSLELNYIVRTAGPYPIPDSSVEPPFIGQVQLFAGNFAPVGWLFCHGQLVSINAYESLFNLIGTTYGGDGQTTFALPDFRGRTIVGKGLGPEGFTRVVGERGGASQITFSTTNLPLHNHSLPPPDDNGSGYTGGGQSYSNMQPYLVMYAGIYRAGVFPFPDQDTDEPMLGQISFFAGHHALNNPFPASGQLLPINQNQALFALLGTNYGGNGITSFGLPNLNGRTPMGIGAGPGPTNWVLAERPGLVNPTLATGQLPAHEHAVAGLGISTGSTGGGQPVSLMKPTLAVRYIICANGAYPARPFAEGGAIPKAAGDQMLGQINLFAGTFVPAGWLACDGQLLSIPSYVGLFSLLGTNFGGNGTTTFALPDLSSRIPVGSSNGQPGATYGAQETVLTTAQMPAHTHPVPALDFDRWITSYGLGGFGAGFDGDADGDSVKNGFEWATGSNPTNASSFSRLTISSLADDVLVRFPRNTNATDLRLSLQRTGELISSNEWTGLASNHFGAWVPPAAPVTVQETGTNPLTVTISDRRTNSPNAIYRLRVE
jgi:microcystin-dependent protein